MSGLADEFGRVYGLGRGHLLGFSIIVTNREVIGIDTTSQTFRLWQSMVAGVALALPIYIGIVYLAEPILFRINPLLDFATFLTLPLLLAVIMILKVPSLLKKRINRAKTLTLKVSRNDISQVEFSKPNRFDQKGRFSVKAKSRGGFDFWTVGGAQFESVMLLLQKFCSKEPNIVLAEKAS